MGRSERKNKRKQRDDGAEVAATAVEAEAPGEAAAPEIRARDVSGDVGRLDGAEWPQKPWPPAAGNRGAGFQLVVKRSVMNAIHHHGQANRDVEVCGVLVGNVYRDEVGAYAVVDASIKGDFAGSANAQVTFTAQTWDHIQGVMEREHPNQRIVGWYHTHPGFGIFLSDMDLFIHGNFFNLPWQSAMVYDPVSGEEGVFLWKDGKTERSHFAVDEDVEREIPTIAASPEITAAALADFSRRMQGLEKRFKTFTVMMPLLLLVAVAWPFVLYTAMADKRPRWSPAKSNENAAATQVAAPATQPVVMIPAPATQNVVAQVQQAIAPATTQPAVETQANVPVEIAATQAAVATTQGAQAEVKKPVESGVPELIKPGGEEKKGPKILDKPPGGSNP